MSFNLEKFFEDIFAPQKDETLTILYDLPHDSIKDNKDWKDRREMADDWHKTLSKSKDRWSIVVNPVVTYLATGASNGDLPEKGQMGGKEVDLEKVISESSIILIMPQFSATAPVKTIAKKSGKVRGGSMPGVGKFMEKTSLAADYALIQAKCKEIAPIFEKAIGAEAVFSTGHKCYFDISTDNPVHRSDGYLHAEVAGTIAAVCNLPTGEVYVVPNEKPDSKTKGELPEKFKDELVVYTVKNNKIIDVKGDGPKALKMKDSFSRDPAWRNIAEFAIGCNDKAKVCGNILEDEKAGFHWAYGRSDHFGGLIGPKDFISPSNVVHEDVIYAKESPIRCKQLDMIFPDGTKKTLIIDGELQL